MKKSAKLISLFLILPFANIKAQTKKPINYVAFGDSYTICTGTSNTDEHWPNILTTHLNESGIAVELIANPSRNGFTTQNLIDTELPLLNTTAIDFATLLIGVNDWVRQIDIDTYHKNLSFIIDAIQKKLTNKNHLLLITIPDFGLTPQGALYGNGRDITKGILEFNAIIKSEAKKRGLVCVDVFRVSQDMKNNKELVAADGLHPSAKEYAIWETMILPEAKKLLVK
jgi:lysophospholipase L1-like esterase